jgi:hypothetical protein
VLAHAGASEIHKELHALVRAGRHADLATAVPDAVIDAMVLIDEPVRLAARIRARYEGLLTQAGLYRGGDRFMTEEDWQRFVDAMMHTSEKDR